jgi:hypothetical protein
MMKVLACVSTQTCVGSTEDITTASSRVVDPFDFARGNSDPFGLVIATGNPLEPIVMKAIADVPFCDCANAASETDNRKSGGNAAARTLRTIRRANFDTTHLLR